MSINFLSLLFLFTILLYKSFKSLVANLPPSSCTIGLKSGGITGIASSIIHSGLLSDWMKASITSSLLVILIFFCPVASWSSSWSSSFSFCRSTFTRRSLIASAPIFAVNLSPYSFLNSLYSISERSCFS